MINEFFEVDALKDRYHKINYVTDQVLHYIVMLVYLLQEVKHD